MELLAGLLLFAIVSIAGVSKSETKACFLIPEVNKGQLFLTGSLNSEGEGIDTKNNFFEHHCSCIKVTENNESIIYNCTEHSSGAQNCPQNTIIAEVSTVNGLQIAIVQSHLSSTSTTTSQVTKTEPKTNSTEAQPQDVNAGANNAPNSHLHLWIIIGCQFLVIVVLVACLLRLRLRGAIKNKSALQIVNVPQSYQQLATPIEEAANLPPTPRAAFQHPPPPAEAFYEVNTNYGVEPSPRRAKLAVYEDHRFDEKHPRTHQHNVYTKTLDQQEQGTKSYYSTVNVQKT